MTRRGPAGARRARRVGIVASPADTVALHPCFGLSRGGGWPAASGGLAASLWPEPPETALAIYSKKSYKRSAMKPT